MMSDLEVIGRQTMLALRVTISHILDKYMMDLARFKSEFRYWLDTRQCDDRITIQFKPSCIEVTMMSDRGTYTPHFKKTTIDYADPNYVSELARVLMACHVVFGKKQCPNFLSKSS
jgi:hypothetical protein